MTRISIPPISPPVAKKAQPLVSVIVPTRNSARYLHCCLASLRSQTYDNLEIIVVDNHSSDNTRLIATDHGATVVTCGPERSAQVNRGVAIAHGTFVFRVDSDFYVNPGVIDECVNLALAGFDAVVVHNTPRVVGRLSRIRKFEVDMYKYSLDHSAARFLTRSLYRKIGGYNETLTAGEDYDFQNQLSAHGATIGFAHLECVHLDEPTDLLPHLKKYYYYGLDFHHYLRLNRERGSTQLAFFRRDYARHWREFARHPMLGGGFAVYHTLKYMAGVAGYASGVLRIMSRRVWLQLR